MPPKVHTFTLEFARPTKAQFGATIGTIMIEQVFFLFKNFVLDEPSDNRPQSALPCTHGTHCSHRQAGEAAVMK